MTVATESPPLSPTWDLDPIRYFFLPDVDWATYRAVADALCERRLRFAFDGSNLEFMTTSRLHSRLSRALGRLVVTLSEELGLPISSDGDFTLERDDIRRGVQADECFYLQNVAAVRGKDELDLTVDPPPDLAIEIDVSRSSMNRLGIYAQIGVPEIWRLKDAALECYLRDKSGHYRRNEMSAAFSGLRPQVLLPFLVRLMEGDQNATILDFRVWVRDRIARNWAEAT